MACLSLPGLIDAVAERCGESCAIVEGGTHLTFADLARESRRVAAGLRVLGLGRGDVLAAWLPTSTSGSSWSMHAAGFRSEEIKSPLSV